MAPLKSASGQLLTHKHRDLTEQFQARAKAVGGDPPQITDLKAQIQRLTDDNARLRKDSAEQHELAQFYANVINELAAALDYAAMAPDPTLDNVRAISKSRSPAQR